MSPPVSRFLSGGRRSSPSAIVGATLFACLLLSPASASAAKQYANGVACTFSSDCASGRCVFDVCTARSGSGKQYGNGIACRFSSDCASGRCVFDVCTAR